MLSPARLPPEESGSSDRFRVDVPSDISLVGEIVEAVCACCFAGNTPTSRTRFRLCTVVAEAVANAMLYGNGSDPSRQVVIELELGPHQVVIAVSDQGDGFDHQTVPFPIGDESREATRGRGLFMIHRLADHVSFNDRGNTIWMTLPRH